MAAQELDGPYQQVRYRDAPDQKSFQGSQVCHELSQETRIG